MADTRPPKLPAGVSEAFLKLMEQPVSFHPAIARLCGSVNAGLMLSQAIYWSRMKHVQEKGGWFYKSHIEWTDETCLSQQEQRTATTILVSRGFLQTDVRRQQTGSTVKHFKVNFEAVLGAHVVASNIPGMLPATNQECCQQQLRGVASNTTLVASNIPYKEQENSQETSKRFHIHSKNSHGSPRTEKHEIWIHRILNTHPRPEWGSGLERVLWECIEEEMRARGWSEIQACEYLHERTKLYALKEKKFIMSATNFFGKRVYRQDEALWGREVQPQDLVSKLYAKNEQA
jgi:hypothetical protein